jgi:hypothetical protein
VEIPLRAKRVLVVVRDPDAVQTICDFLESLVEPELDQSLQAVDPVPPALASYPDLGAIVDQALAALPATSDISGDGVGNISTYRW